MAKASYKEGDIIKSPKLTAASNGYVLTCDLYRKDEKSTYDGECYVGEHQMVFNSSEGNKAIATLTDYAKKAGLLEEAENTDNASEESKE